MRSLILCGLLLLGAAQEKPEPTLDETAKWIQTTCDVQAPRTGLSFDGCTISGFWRRRLDGVFLWCATIPLKEVKSLSVDLDRSEWRVQLHTEKSFPAHFNAR